MFDRAQNDRAGTWTLVPEPAVGALLALSLLGILWRRGC